MPTPTQIDSHLVAPLAGRTTRASAGTDDTAQPSLTSGFGAVMEQEHDIQSSTARYLGASSPNPIALDRILRHQGTQLGANIALLNERYEMLPRPARFHARPAARLSHASRSETDASVENRLRSLIAQHLDLLQKIKALMSHRPDGQRGELILAEIARNHEEMAWVLTGLINEDESVRDLIPMPVTASVRNAPLLGKSEASWENEGGSGPARPSVN